MNSPDIFPSLLTTCVLNNIKIKISGIEHVKYKESNRYDGTLSILKKMGVDIKQEKKNAFKIKGRNKLYNTNNLDCFNDHRLAMMISVAQILSKNNVSYDKCINVSFPQFKSTIKKVLI